jgi:hypothetical protein
MPITFIGFIVLWVIARSFKASTKFVIFAFLFSDLFQASAAFIFGATGLLPASILILALIILCVRKGNISGKLSEMLRLPSAGFVLCVLMLYCPLTAYFLPRFFAGVTDINPVGGGAIEISGLPVFYQLGPSPGNVTQSIYICSAYMVFFLICMIIESQEEYALLLRGFMMMAIWNAVFGFLDVVTYATHTDFLFAIVRNSNYVLRTDETGFLGLKRIAGTFTETSGFSAITLVFFTFTMRLWLGSFNSKYLLMFSIIQFVFLLLSTSSTALAGLAVMGTVLWITSLSRLLTRPVPSTVYGFVVFVPLIIGSLSLGIMLNPTARDAVVGIINSTLLEKSQTASGIERLALNAQAIINFKETWGIGVGAGSARASSLPLVVLSNIGIPGALLLGTFLLLIFLTRQPVVEGSDEATFVHAARLACFADLLTGAISGTSMDLGLLFFVFAAASYLPRFAYWRNLNLSEGTATDYRPRPNKEIRQEAM